MINTNDTVDFMMTHKLFNSRPQLMAAINKHIEFDTVTTLEDDLGLIAAMRFNIDTECLHVLDLVIRPDVARNNVIKWITAKTWHRFPFLKFFKFNRALKYPNRPQRAYNIARLLKG